MEIETRDHRRLNATRLWKGPAYGKDLKKYGDSPLDLIFQVAERFNTALQEPLFAPEWRDLGMTIDELAMRSNGLPIPIDCARRACKEQLAELRSGKRPTALGHSIILKYLVQLYDVRFAGRIPQTGHPNGASYPEMMARLCIVRPWVLEHLEALAQRIAKKKSVRAIRLPRRHHRPTVDQDTDLEHIGL
jgi:hypothetical protein